MKKRVISGISEVLHILGGHTQPDPQMPILHCYISRLIIDQFIISIKHQISNLFHIILANHLFNSIKNDKQIITGVCNFEHTDCSFLGH